MSCHVCDQELTDDDFKIETACCENICHTTCFFQRVRQDWDYVACGICDTILKERVTSAVVETVESPALTTAVRRVKNCMRISNLAERAMKTVMNTQYQTFKETAEPLLTSLKSLQRQTMTDIKQTPEFRECLKQHRKVTASVNKVIKDHNVTHRYLREHGAKQFRMTPSWMIKRKFRIRL